MTAPADPGVGPIVPDDRPRWAQLFCAYLEFYGTEIPPSTYEATWARLMAPDGTIRGLGVRDAAGQLVAISHYLFHPTSSSDRPVCYMQDLFTDPAARGKGCARALINGVAEAARSRNAVRVYWLTQEDNKTARALYEKLAKFSGFVRYDIRL
ncbi:GNAT family N-acetyltransferase [Roseiterribacter gracilis]|uniref:N-acetyltransferase n=1 Tax=Roseiterribacter gracilis TaxID=2812848 RepID=A0A8S8XDA4_9PROT|nr:N-acetyltransferase [Rhodospirillales bacterium TMPK1]